jgi:hypothetical protein
MNGTRASDIRGKRGRRAPGPRGLRIVVVVAGLVVLLGAAGAAARGASEVATGELALGAELRLDSIPGACSPPPGGECAAPPARASSPGSGP